MLEALDLQEDSKILMPGTKEVKKVDDSQPKVLGDDRKYRSIAATINPPTRPLVRSTLFVVCTSLSPLQVAPVLVPDIVPNCYLAAFASPWT